MKKRGLKKLFQRHSRQKEQKITILVLCEGEKTEVLYFKDLCERLGLKARNSKVAIHVECSNVGDPRGIFEEAMRRYEDDQFNLVMCVFDLENNSDHMKKFGKLRPTAAVQVFPSNPCFEVWFLLHFGAKIGSLNNGKEAKKAVQKIKAMKHYDGKNADHELLFKLLATAVTNAKRLEKQGLNNPMTKVHLLVEHLKQYSYCGCLPTLTVNNTL